jgi:hypothetical protein
VSLFLKSEKKALLYVGKGPEYMPFAIFNCSFSLLALGTVSNYRRACTQALLLYETTHNFFH